jgi:hypothetical protein
MLRVLIKIHLGKIGLRNETRRKKETVVSRIYTLTLSEEEAVMLKIIMGKISGGGAISDFTSEIYYGLPDFVTFTKFAVPENQATWA